MAAEWIKAEVGLHQKPEVAAIAEATGLEDYAVVGRLLALWQWFDQHTVDGNAVGVTRNWLDRLVHHIGFAAAMERAGWLNVDATGVRLPNFAKHNGQTAKARAVTNKRVARHRTKVTPTVTQHEQSCNADTVTKSVTRKRKRLRINTASAVLGGDAAEPSPGPDSVTPSPADSPARPRNELFDAIVEVFYPPPAKLAKSHHSRCGAAAAELRQLEATPDEIRTRSDRYRERFPGFDFNVNAVIKHWHSLGADVDSPRAGDRGLSALGVAQHRRADKASRLFSPTAPPPIRTFNSDGSVTDNRSAVAS